MGGKIKTHKGPNKPQPTFLSYFSGFHSGGEGVPASFRIEGRPAAARSRGGKVETYLWRQRSRSRGPPRGALGSRRPAGES